MEQVDSIDFDVQRGLHMVEAWNRKHILKQLYKSWWDAISAYLIPTYPTIELGSGIGNLKDFCPNLITSDIIKDPWIDVCMDAHHLPLARSAHKNIIAIDAFHHLNNPSQFIKDVINTSCSGDRVILLEPYISLLSYTFYKFVHHESFNLREKYTDYVPTDSRQITSCNECRAQMTFQKFRKSFETQFPGLKIIHSRYLSGLSYPLTGGFNYHSLIPIFLFNMMEKFERAMPQHIMRFTAFKILIVFERT